MSWHFSQALVAAYSGASCLDGEPSAPSKSKTTRAKCSSNAKTTDALSPSRYGMTSAPSTANHGEELLTSYLAAFHAKTSAPLARGQGLAVKDPVFGLRWPELFARYDRDTYSWKTHQDLFATEWTELQVTLPRWGMIASGRLCPVTPLVHQQKVSAFGYSLPRPTKSHGLKGDWGFGAPTNNRYSSSVRYATRKLLGKKPTPTGVEWILGWPIGWTALQPLATDKIRYWLQSHGGYLEGQ